MNKKKKTSRLKHRKNRERIKNIISNIWNKIYNRKYDELENLHIDRT